MEKHEDPIHEALYKITTLGIHVGVLHDLLVQRGIFTHEEYERLFKEAEADVLKALEEKLRRLREGEG